MRLGFFFGVVVLEDDGAGTGTQSAGLGLKANSGLGFVESFCGVTSRSFFPLGLLFQMIDLMMAAAYFGEVVGDEVDGVEVLVMPLRLGCVF